MQVIPINPEAMTLYVNGVHQPATEATLRTFRLIFLASFGIIGLIFSLIGGLLIWRFRIKRRRSAHLKRDGARLEAVVIGLETAYQHRRNASFGITNVRFLPSYLRCAYETSNGETYIFKSDLLRADPTPFLRDDKIKVYYDRENMSKYFVDVDGSIELGSRVFEL